ncbi:MAG: lipid-binding SYLF domain-containing protein [Psychroserpens sp.]|uniref:lipid-binding SYLF domain-containing protein n=1 Tax=Psychroserpens sp. TaxID=2020870 RepID=UPI003002FF79
MKSIITVVTMLFCVSVIAQIGGWNPKLEEEANTALTLMIEETPKLETFKTKAYGYAVFPKITKAGIGIGAAAGNGVVYQNDNLVGSSKLKQASIGLQLGGQQYSEVIFFENKKAFEHFTNGNLKFDAQASAVVITEGASIDVAYKNGVAVFTRAKGGLMFEASIGGQHFTYKRKK